MDDIDPKLLKIVALAKAGIGGEKDVAIALVKRICERDGLDFDEVMSDTDKPRKFEPEIKVRGRDELRIIIQVVARFATTPEHPDLRAGYWSWNKTVWVEYTTTAARHIDTLNAMNVYLKAYRIEKKKFLESLKDAFVQHHNLYSQFYEPPDDEEPKPEKTLEQRQAEWRAAHMSQLMTEQVNIVKEIDSGEDTKV